MNRSLAVILLTGCSEISTVGYSGISASPGGAEDIAYARDLVANGGVPAAGDVTVEGLLSEHDLPVSGAPCEDLLCARPIAGRALDLRTGEAALWLQVGLASGLPAPLVRPPVDLVVVVDRSASMDVDMDQVETAVVRLIDQLGPDDRLSIVTFNDKIDVLQPLAPVGDAGELRRDVRALTARGDWEPMAALAAARAELDRGGNHADRLRRIVMLTCAYPGGAELGTFLADAAEARIGFSMYGVLLWWDPGLADLLGATRGGRFAYLGGLDDVEQAFDEDFDASITPLAYDLSLGATWREGWTMPEGFGVPGDALTLDVTTVFASTRGGGVFARLEGEGDLAGELALSYVPETAHGLSASSEVTPVEVVDPTPFGVAKGAALVNEALLVDEACTLYGEGEPEAAVARLTLLRDHFAQVRADLDEPAFDAELGFVDALIANIRGG